MEDRLPSAPAGKFYEIASIVDFNISQRKAIVSAPMTLECKFKILRQGRTHLSSSIEIAPQDNRPNYFF